MRKVQQRGRVSKGPAKRKKPGSVPRKSRTPSEQEIHMKCWQWVQGTYPELLIFHVANERKAKVQYHVKLKRLGVMAGVADFLAFPASGRKVAIELKDDEGDQDVDQIRFQKRWEASGGLYFVVRTLEHFQGVVSGLMFPWAVPTL